MLEERGIGRDTYDVYLAFPGSFKERGYVALEAGFVVL